MSPPPPLAADPGLHVSRRELAAVCGPKPEGGQRGQLEFRHFLLGCPCFVGCGAGAHKNSILLYFTHTHASTHAHNVMHTSVHADTYLRRKEGKSTTARNQVETPSLPSNYVEIKAADSRQTLRKSQERTWGNDVQSKEGEGVLRRGTWPA